MIEKLPKALDKGGETGAVLTDLSKPFDCIDHSLLIAKLDAYGFEKQSIDFLHSYLTKRKQRTYSSWEMLLSGVPQGSILGPLYISAICFLKRQKILISLDMQTTILLTHILQTSVRRSEEEVLENLQGGLEQLFQWFSANHLVANAGKCHLLTSSKITKNIAISNTNVSSEQKVKLLGIYLESRLDFDYHVNTLLNKANKKYHALARVCNYMNSNKRRVPL